MNVAFMSLSATGRREGATSKMNRKSEDLPGKKEIRLNTRVSDGRPRGQGTADTIRGKSGHPRINVNWSGDFFCLFPASPD
jgi:hypothetical protein